MQTLATYGTSDNPAHCPQAPRWVWFVVFLIPAGFAALLALQDTDTLALAGESTLYVALVFKWVVVAYLWPLMMLPAWLLSRRAFFHCRPHQYVFAQLILGPAIAYLHIWIFWLILSRFAGMGPFALRHPRVYYLTSRYITEIVLYYGLLIALHAALWYRRIHSERLQRLHLENDLLLAQLQMLSIQLQPHFLFNTLNSVSSLMRKDIDAADELLIEVGKFLRKTLAVSMRSTISLEEEISLVETYYHLQNIRHANRASLLLDLALPTLAVQVPPMILQPIIENAFTHSGSGSLAIGISASLQERLVRLRIENNRAQLRADALAHSEKRIGLRNVRERLQCLFGATSSLSIRNSTHDSVCVEMTIPLGPHGDLQHA